MRIPTGTVSVTDYHTAGEPFRIVTAGQPDIAGSTVLDRRQFAQSSPEVQSVRKLLVNEPRGHADMYGGFLVPPDDDGAHFGVLFWHKDGFSTACGHGCIALGAWAVNTGRVPAVPDGETEVVIDVPSGRVTVRVDSTRGRVRRVSFRNIASYVIARNVPVSTSYGPMLADLSYGGAIYASVKVRSAGLSVIPGRYSELIALGREVKWALNESAWARHPSEPRLGGVYGTILFEDLGQDEEGPRQRNVTVFADGEVDRSPCGSGTSARLALLAADGRLAAGQSLRHESIIDTTFRARVVAEVDIEGRAGVVTEIEGMAYQTGAATFSLDPDDPLGTGFVLR